MNRNSKRAWSIAAAAFILLALALSACTPTSPSTTSTSTPTPSGSAAATPSSSTPEQSNGLRELPDVMPLTIVNYNTSEVPTDVDFNNNRWADIFREGVPNVDINWIIVPSNEAVDRINIMMQSGDFPDMLPTSQAYMLTWADMGLIQPLDDIIDNYYPNIYNWLTDTDFKYTEYKGQRWMLPTCGNAYAGPNMMYIRTDWLENVGMEMPTTTDELYDVLYAFTYNDPDKNDRNDTYGLTGVKGLHNVNNIMTAFGVFVAANECYWHWSDGKLLPDIVRPEMKQALEYLAKLYADGLVDRDLLVQVQSEMEGKVTSDIAGLWGLNTWGQNVRVAKVFMDNATGQEFSPLPNLYGPTGIKGGVPTKNNNIGPMTYVITAACEYPEAAAILMNWLIEEDTTYAPYYTLNHDRLNMGDLGFHSYGTEGSRYLNVGSPAGTSQEDQDKAALDNWRLVYRFAMGTTNMMPAEEQVEIARFSVEGSSTIHSHYVTDREIQVAEPFFSDLFVTGPVYGAKWNELFDYFSEIKMNIFTGTSPISAFDDWVAYFYANGGTEMIEEATEMN